MQLVAETDYTEEVIKSRKKEIDQIESIMTDINSIAKDLSIETNKQGETLQRLDTNVTTARDNAKDGLSELH